MILFTYDSQVDAVSIRWSDAEIVNTNEVDDDVMVDYDQDGNAVAIEILDASKRIQYLTPESASILLPTQSAQAHEAGEWPVGTEGRALGGLPTSRSEAA